MTLGNTKVERPPNQLHLEGGRNIPFSSAPLSLPSPPAVGGLVFSSAYEFRETGHGSLRARPGCGIIGQHPHQDSQIRIGRCGNAHQQVPPSPLPPQTRYARTATSPQATEQPQAANPANVGECCELRRIPHRARASRYNASQRLCQTGNPFYDFGR